MPKRAKELTAAEVRKAGPGRHADGLNLYLLVSKTNQKFWTLRYNLNQRPREMGLGPASGRAAISLADARRKARPFYEMIRDGRDPLAERDAKRAAAKAEAQNAKLKGKTFAEASALWVASMEASWKSKNTGPWTAGRFRTYTFPHFGDVPVNSITTTHVLAALDPIWRTKMRTAQELQLGIESVLDYAKVRGWREGENPARWKAHLEHSLPRIVGKTRNHPAISWREVAAFIADLRRIDGTAARCLEFINLNAVRSVVGREAKWDEIDMQERAWTIPAQRMKTSQKIPHDFRIPLSDAAIKVLEAVAPLRNDTDTDYIFPRQYGRTPLAKDNLLWVLDALGHTVDPETRHRDVTVAGARSTFKDWAAETGQPDDVSEAALAHAPKGGDTYRAYQRGDLLERRRKLMNAWASWCERPEGPADIIEFHRSKLFAASP